MGLFSKTKTYVETTTLRLVEDTPNILQQSIRTSILGNRPIVDDMLANVMRGLGAQADSYYRYGRDKYYFGLPQGSIEAAPASASTVGLVLADIEGGDVKVEYCVASIADATYFAHPFLQSNRGWDYSTDIVSNPPFGSGGDTVYYSKARFLSSTKIIITYIYGAGNTYEEQITVPAVSLNDIYYHSSYLTGDFTGARKYWTYNASLGTYPTLNINTKPDSPYYPVVPLRRNKEDWTVDDGSERYKTSKRLLGRFNIEIDELGTGINGNPDINDVDHAYVILGVHLQSKVPQTQDYLYRYFKHLEGLSEYTEDDYIRWTARDPAYQDSVIPKMNKVTVKEEDYHIEVGYLYINSEMKNGVLGKTGFVNTETIVKPKISRGYYSFETSEFIIRKQLTATTYEEVTIVGLKHVNYIYGNYTVDTNLADSLVEEEDDFILPLHNEVAKSISVFKRTDLMYDALRIVFNSIIIRKLKWYETGFFQLVLIVVAIVLTVVSYGALSESLAVAMGFTAGTASAAIVGFLAYAAVNIAIQYGFQFLIDVLGVNIAFVIAIVAAVYGVVGQINGAPFADAALQVQSGFTNGLSNKFDSEMKDLLSDWEVLQKEMEDAWLELREMEAELNTDGLIDPMILLNNTSGLASPNESPEDYYNTRIHSGNIGVNAFKAIEHFVPINLTLQGTTKHGGLV